MITIQINDNSNQAKELVRYIKTLPFVKIEDEPKYNPEFIKMIKKAEKEKSIRVNPKNVWESIK